MNNKLWILTALAALTYVNKYRGITRNESEQQLVTPNEGESTQERPIKVYGPKPYPKGTHKPDHKDPWDKNNKKDNKEKPFKLKPGYNRVYEDEELKIVLEENRSAGYMWRAYFPRGVEVIKDQYKPSDKKYLGAPGKHIWILKMKKPGRYNIVMEYVNSGSPYYVYDKVQYMVEARECKCSSREEESEK